LSQFKPIYSIDQNITFQSLSKLYEIFSPSEGTFSEPIYNFFSSLPTSRANFLRKKIETWLTETYTKGIKEEDLNSKKQEFISFLVKEVSLPENIAKEIANLLIKPNMFINQKETEDKKQELIRSIRPIERLIQKGEVIIRRGEKVTEEKFAILDALGYTTSTKNILRFIGYLGIVIALQILINIFYMDLIPDAKDFNIIFLINSFFSLALLLIKFFSYYSPYLAPITSIFFISAGLINLPTYFLLNFSIILISGLFSYSFFIFIILFLDSLIVFYRSKDLEDRFSYIKISLTLILIRIPLILFGNLSLRDPNFDYTGVLFNLVNPILSAILALGSLPFIESIFRLATPLKLLELTNPNYPLLRKLLLEAPGTYYHSILVGNLAERAAKEAKANEYVVRTASFYHDIGKIKRPQYFIENLIPGQINPHEHLSPYISAIIIKSHPKDGTELLRKYKFPKNIVDIVEQHHGTSLITYFYNKQKEISGENVLEEDFRYSGCKPESKEAAIVMLADSIEAATRSLPNITPENIEKTVRDIISDKLIDGQLEHSKLTLEELEKISQSFIKTLIELRHPRIPYPHEFKNIEIPFLKSPK